MCHNLSHKSAYFSHRKATQFSRNCKGPENIKELMEESYKVIESALPDEYKGKVDNPDQ